MPGSAAGACAPWRCGCAITRPPRSASRAGWRSGRSGGGAPPALPGCPGHDLFLRDFKGSSGLFAFTLAGGSDAARAALIDTLDLFGIGYSWGGYESLAIPIDPQRHRSVTTRDDAGPMVRLQIGLEDPDDLIADLERGLAAWRATAA